MKELHSLSIDDLMETPVWELFTGANHVACVVPSPKTEITERGADEEGKAYIVRAHFWLKDGTEYIGFCSPQDPSGIDYIQPVIVTERGHVNFYHEGTVDDSIRLSYLQRLDKQEERVFPIAYMADILSDGVFLTDRITDFGTT